MIRRKDRSFQARRDVNFLDDLYTGRNPDLIASLVGALLKEGEEFFKTHMGPSGDAQDGTATWNVLRPDQQNALLVQYYNAGAHLEDKAQYYSSIGQRWDPQNRLGDGGALYAFPGHVTLLRQALNAPKCFAPDTPILLVDGAGKSISKIAIGDLVAAFDGTRQDDGVLHARRVVRQFSNVMAEWLILSCGLTVPTERRGSTHPADGQNRSLINVHPKGALHRLSLGGCEELMLQLVATGFSFDFTARRQG